MRGDVDFVVPSEAGGEQVLRGVGERFPADAEPPRKRTTVYCDTFDWRVYRDGGTLELTRTDRGGFLYWRALDGTIRQRLAADGLPAFAADLPGPFRDRLGPVIAMRRLLPLVEVTVKARGLRVLDSEQKTVARLFLESGSAVLDGRADGRHVLEPRVRLEPVRGYEEVASLLREDLATRSGLTPTVRELEAALAAFGRTPGDYSSKVRLQLDPAMRSDDAARTILRSLLATLRRNEEGTARDLDSEFLHDFRVAVRRTRSALGQIRHVFPPDALEPFRGEFAWLGERTGPTRDLDVYLLKMDEHRGALPAELGRDLEPFVRFLRQRKRDEQAALAAELGSARYAELVSAWTAFLDRGPEVETPARNGSRPIAELAVSRLRKVFRNVVRRGRSIDGDSPPEALHALRIDCKKLRYLLEFFRSLFPTVEVDRTVRALKGLQDVLGDFNDLSLQRRMLYEYAGQMAERGAPPATLLAIGQLVERLRRRREEERASFAGLFAAFDAPEIRRSVRRMLAGPVGDDR